MSLVPLIEFWLNAVLCAQLVYGTDFDFTVFLPLIALIQSRRMAKLSSDLVPLTVLAEMTASVSLNWMFATVFCCCVFLLL